MRTYLMLLAVCGFTSSCYVKEFFARKPQAAHNAQVEVSVLGQSLGNRAGTLDETALAEVHAVAGTHAPAEVRPDPDMMIRRLIRQYRSEGTIVAREIGRVEQFRMLLGGASQDFKTAPQDGYDATSLLATYKVAEEVCRGLVAPTRWEHPGWDSILPYAPSKKTENVTFLAQRFTGMPSAQLPAASIQQLIAILDDTAASASTEATSGSAASGAVLGLVNEAYVPVCATLALDVESLFF